MELQNNYLDWLKVVNPELKTNKEKAELKKIIRHTKRKQNTFYKQLLKFKFGIRKKKFKIKKVSFDFEQELDTNEISVQIKIDNYENN